MGVWNISYLERNSLIALIKEATAGVLEHLALAEATQLALSSFKLLINAQGRLPITDVHGFPLYFWEHTGITVGLWGLQQYNKVYFKSGGLI